MDSTGSIPAITLNSQIQFYLLSKQIESGVAIIGRGDQFLELPVEGLHFIRWLQNGLTLSEARRRFEYKFNQFPEEECLDVVKAFLTCDFIAQVDGHAVSTLHQPNQIPTKVQPSAWAKILFSEPMLHIWLLFVIPAACLWVVNDELWPRPSDFFWVDSYFIVVLVGLLVWLIDMSLHEFAHWAACKAKGIHATITWTYRLGIFPMSQTIMHNIWAVPRSARLLPISAGMALDIAKISLVIYLLYLGSVQFLYLPMIVVSFLKFYLLRNVAALVAQFWLFSKMDGYFLFSSLFKQRNLQADTYAWLRTSLNRRQSFDPPREGMKFIYLYGVITLLFGALFVAQYVLVQLPIRIQLIWDSLIRTVSYPTTSFEFADGVAVLTSQFIYLGLLMFAYWQEKNLRQHKQR